MGGDGGTTANNRRFLPQAGFGVAKKVKDKTQVDRERWSTCHLTKNPLRPPVLADRVGHLYSAEYVIAALTKKEPVAAYIKGMKDFVSLKPEIATGREEAYESMQAGEDALDFESCLNLYMCPVTQQTTNGTNKFCCASACGHVFSLKALKQMGDNACPVCGGDASPESGNRILNLVPDQDDVEGLEEKEASRRLAELEEKQAKKKRKAAEGGSEAKRRKTE